MPNKDFYLKIEFVCFKKNLSLIEEILYALEATSHDVSSMSNFSFYEIPAGHIPVWDKLKVTALFDFSVNKKTLSSCLLEHVDGTIKYSSLKNINWVEKFQNNSPPIKIGKKILILPTWEQKPKNTLRKILRIDPGIAFGSGSHETTKLCLQYIENIKLNEKTVLDYGCGSGVLGVAAAIFGASYVACVDTDIQALENTNLNAKKNHVSKKINTIRKGEIKNSFFDYIFANIFQDTLIVLKDEFYSYLRPGGKIILSGILSSQIDKIKSNFGEYFCLEKEYKKGDWSLLAYKKS